MSNDSLSDRMKRYEEATRTVLTPRMPVIMRIDGKAFHTYTQGCDRPFDKRLGAVMADTAKKLCESIQGAQLAYTQSDEISLLLHSYKKFDSAAWFDNQVQKMASVAAGIASSHFTANSWKIWAQTVRGELTNSTDDIRAAVFDARAFTVPEPDVCNYFLWRQQDATRNSIQMLARSLWSHKECHGKSSSELQEMCFRRGKNWNDIETRWKRGLCVRKVYEALPVGSWQPGDPESQLRPRWDVDTEIPLFNQDRSYVERYLVLEEE